MNVSYDTAKETGAFLSNISRYTGPIFAIFTSNESILGVDDRSEPLFFDIPRDVAMTTDFVQKWDKIAYPPALIALSLETVSDIATSMGELTAQMMPVYCVKIS